MFTQVRLFIGLFLYSKRLIFYPVFVVSSTPEVFLHNGHFSWRQQEETDEEEGGGVFSTAGELTNIDLCVDTVRTPLYIFNTKSSQFCIYGSIVSLKW